MKNSSVFIGLLVFISACGNASDDSQEPDDGTCVGPERYSLTFEKVGGDCPAMRNRTFTNQQGKIPFDVGSDSDCEQTLLCENGNLHLDVWCKLSSHVVPGETISTVDFNVPDGSGTLVINVNKDQDYDPDYVCTGTYNVTLEP